MKHKERLDVVLVERGLCDSRSKAQALIMSGEVYVNGQKSDKAGTPVEDEAVVELRGNPCPYVSRGGLKLEKALRDFGVDPTGFVCSDSGASTGGFTDCLLQKGAKKVFAIDVGYGQLAWSIRMLYEHPALCAEMGAAGALRGKEFSPEHYYAEFVRIAHDMIETGGAL